MKHVFYGLVGVLLSFLMGGCGSSNENHPEQPNILWIVADDLGPNLGCYGTPQVKTPHIDQLASEGVLYKNCFTVTAVCSPSRSAMVTGMYPVSIDAHQHRTRGKAKKPLADDVKVITRYFQNAGYFTFNGTVKGRNKAGKQDYNFTTDSPIYDGTDWTQRKEGQPFFGQIQIFMPHRPFHPDPQNPVDPDKVKLPPYLPDHWVARQDWAFYLETIQHMDREVGEVLKRLKEEGLADNTYVFFFGDQGRPMVREKQFLYDGGIHTPLIIRTPGDKHKGEIRKELISNVDLAATSLAIAGIKVPAYMAGQNFWGKHTPRKYVFSMRDRRDETVDRIRAVRSDRFKYIRNFYPQRPYVQYNAYKRDKYPTLSLMEVLADEGKLGKNQMLHMSEEKPVEELYDIQKDPFEVNNLAGDPQYSSIKDSLSGILDKWMTEFDTATYPEDSTEVDFWKKQMAKKDSLWKTKKGLPVDVSDRERLEWWENRLRQMAAIDENEN